jgi:hypothetical protein
MPGKARSRPRAASWAGKRHRAFRRLQWAILEILAVTPFFPFSKCPDFTGGLQSYFNAMAGTRCGYFVGTSLTTNKKPRHNSLL